MKLYKIIFEDENLDELGGVPGYVAPLGASGIGSDDDLEKGFWRDDAGKKVKTSSNIIEKKEELTERIVLTKMPRYFFHATTENNAIEIAYTGKLIPHNPSYRSNKTVWDDGSNKRRTYVSETIEDVKNHLPNHSPIILKIPSYIVKFKKEKGTDHWYTDRSVPATEIMYLDTVVNYWKPISNFDIVLPAHEWEEDNVLSEKNMFNKKLLNKMGYDYIGNSNARLGSETFIQDDDPNKENSKSIIKAVNKNLDKTRKDPLHDPATTGITLPQKRRG